MSEFKLTLSETLAYATVALAELRRIQTILDRVFGEMNDQRYVSPTKGCPVPARRCVLCSKTNGEAK